MNVRLSEEVREIMLDEVLTYESMNDCSTQAMLERLGEICLELGIKKNYVINKLFKMCLETEDEEDRQDILLDVLEQL